MNNSFVRLIDGMCATLRAEVLARLDDEFARGQVFGVISLLNTNGTYFGLCAWPCASTC